MVTCYDPIVLLGGVGAFDGAYDVPDGAEGRSPAQGACGDFVGVRIVFACAEVIGEGKGSCQP